MMGGLGTVILPVLLISLSAVACSADKVSAQCMKAYEEGGAPAVFGSSDCPQWILPNETLQDNRQNCQFAMMQGRRDYQEDRVACDLDMKLPFLLGKGVAEEVTIGIAAIFDGHGGEEASELASRKFLDYFHVNVMLNTYMHEVSLNQDNEEADQHNSAFESCQSSLPKVDDRSVRGILEEALKMSFKDIDSEFSMEAMKKDYAAGSTGTVVLLLNDELLIGYVGDSKALLCKQVEKLHSEELTKDHHPDREEEKARIEAAGGFVRVWGVPRVNGILAVSRAIGDIYLKRFGVISEPEIIGWRKLTAEDSYLVIACDGIFEGMTSQQVCELMPGRDQGKEAWKNLVYCSSSSSLADCVINTAFRKGSTDNLSAIIIPLRPLPSAQQDSETMDRAEL